MLRNASYFPAWMAADHNANPASLGIEAADSGDRDGLCCAASAIG
jgi:hypothetical protein